MENDLTIRSAKRQIILSDGTVYLYGSDSTMSSHSTIRCACVLRALAERVIAWWICLRVHSHWYVIPPILTVCWMTLSDDIQVPIRGIWCLQSILPRIQWCCPTSSIQISCSTIFTGQAKLTPTEVQWPIEKVGVRQTRRCRHHGWIFKSFLPCHERCWRLVNVFTALGRYSKPQSSLLPDVD